MKLMKERASSRNSASLSPELQKPMQAHVPVLPIPAPTKAQPSMAAAMYPGEVSAEVQIPSAPSPSTMQPAVRCPPRPSTEAVEVPPAPSPQVVPPPLKSISNGAEVGPGALSPDELRSLFNDRRHGGRPDTIITAVRPEMDSDTVSSVAKVRHMAQGTRGRSPSAPASEAHSGHREMAAPTDNQGGIFDVKLNESIDSPTTRSEVRHGRWYYSPSRLGRSS